MEPKELDDLLANEYEYGEAEDDAEDEEEEDKMEPPPEKKQHMGTNGTAADGNKWSHHVGINPWVMGHQVENPLRHECYL